MATLAVSEDGTEITVRFDSAWSPPIEAIAAICKKYGLTGRMEYVETGMCFVGVAEFDRDWSQNTIEEYRSLKQMERVAAEMGNLLALDEVESMREWARENAE
jgi:hypothetical protein